MKKIKRILSGLVLFLSCPITIWLLGILSILENKKFDLLFAFEIFFRYIIVSLLISVFIFQFCFGLVLIFNHNYDND